MEGKLDTALRIRFAEFRIYLRQKITLGSIEFLNLLSFSLHRRWTDDLPFSQFDNGQNLVPVELVFSLDEDLSQRREFAHHQDDADILPNRLCFHTDVGE